MSKRRRKRKPQRTRREILGAALETFKRMGPINRFVLASEITITSSYIYAHLTRWLKMGLIEWVDGYEEYGAELRITDKGLRWLQRWRELNALMV